MIRRIIRGMALLALAMSASIAAASPPNSPVGTWATEDGQGVIAIAPRGDALCGRIVGIERAPNQPMPTDVHGRSQCGLTIITNQRPRQDGSFLGQITDPRDGSTWQATIHRDEQGNLRLRGFIVTPLLGSTRVWRPFTRRLTKDCGLA
jgi:uncharacterized protein (DUF2147 family)